MKDQQKTGAGEPVDRVLASVEVGRGRVGVRLEVRAQGRDHVLQITGGQAHIGAVAVCAGSRGQAHVRPGVRTVELPHHREGPLATEAAETLALASGRTCAALVGIHQDAATPEEIQCIVANTRAGLQQLVARLGGSGRGGQRP